jgi:hypothetical protein
LVSARMDATSAMGRTAGARVTVPQALLLSAAARDTSPAPVLRHKSVATTERTYIHLDRVRAVSDVQKRMDDPLKGETESEDPPHG